ncbi:MAG: hypothetical protein KDD31_09565 [Muricauda sp.]|nr:hypothetical protein [Allomuricauda sp.]
MKKLTKGIYQIGMFFMLTTLLGCHKNDDGPPFENISLNANQELKQFELGTLGDEEGITIKTQPSHYEISEIWSPHRGSRDIVYAYKPISGFVGKDYAELQIKSVVWGNGNEIEDTIIIKIIKLEISVEE